MTDAKIQDIQKNYDYILQMTGDQSYVNWELFTKSSTEFMKTLDELQKSITILKQIQQKKFLGTMKKLKGADVPDLIKTVKAKKLPKDALKAILGRFKINNDKIQFINSAQELKVQAKTLLEDYVGGNSACAQKAKQTVAFLNQKIKLTGLYEQIISNKQSESTFKHKFDDEVLKQVASKIEIKYIPNTVQLVNIITYSQMIQLTQHVVKSQYKRLTLQSRAKQRSLMNQPLKYRESISEYLNNTQILVVEGFKALANQLGINESKLQQSETALIEKGLAQNIFYIQSNLRAKVKQSLKGSKQVDLKKAKQILQYQISLFNKKTDFFKQFFNGLQKTPESIQLVPMLLALALNDMVFQKYQLEEEDIMKQVTDAIIMTNPQFTKLFKQMETQIIKLMSNVGFINEQAANLLQSQGNMPMPGAFPGGLPDHNQFDLLQLQQLYQIQQMQQQMQQMQNKK